MHNAVSHLGAALLWQFMQQYMLKSKVLPSSENYHVSCRFGRKEKGVTALAPEAQNFDMMYEQTKAIRDGKPIDKPIYNHVSGLLDPPETIKPPKVQPRLHR